MFDVSREYCQVVEAYLPTKWLHHQRVPMEVYLTGLNTGAKETQDSLWGFNIGKNITSAEYGLLGYVVESCETLQAALDALMQFDKTVADIGQIQFIPKAIVGTLVWQPYFHNRHAVLRNMTAWLSTVRRITGKPISPSSVHLQGDFSDSELSELERWYGCQVKGLSDDNYIVFDLSILTTPILSRNELVNSHLLLAAQETKQRFSNEHSWLSELQSVLHSADLHLLTLSMLAEMLNLSTRTLQRRLKAKEKTFSQLVDNERKRRFEQFAPTMRKQMLSDLLGYSEQASMNKAVYRWFGISPSEYVNSKQKKAV